MKCKLCGRGNELNFHHLIPTSLHTNKWFKKNYTSEQLQEGIYICEKDCHLEIHKLVPEKELGKYYNSIDKLLSNEKVRNYINWIKKR
jgi:hypothetical protein